MRQSDYGNRKDEVRDQLAPVPLDDGVALRGHACLSPIFGTHGVDPKSIEQALPLTAG